MEKLSSTTQSNTDGYGARPQFTEDLMADRYHRTSESEIADGLLAQQALLGNEQGFELLVRRYKQPLFNFIYRTLGNYEQSADVLQKVFLKLYLALPQLEQNQSFKAWLFRVTNHCCIDEFRLQNRRPVLYFSELSYISDNNEYSSLDELIETSPLPEEIAIAQDTQRYLLQAIEELPARYRSVVLLRSIAQCSFAEIGQILAMPKTTAKTYFHRAKPQLRAILKGLL